MNLLDRLLTRLFHPTDNVVPFPAERSHVRLVPADELPELEAAQLRHPSLRARTPDEVLVRELEAIRSDDEYARYIRSEWPAPGDTA